MRSPLLRLIWCTCFAYPAMMSAQEERDALIANLNALLRSQGESERDSLNPLIKRDLRILLSTEDGLTFTMDDLPISHVEAPDGSFRLVTWNLPRKDGSHRYEGFLLARQGSRNILFELNDQTPSITSPELAELSADRWYGALYYGVIPVKKGGKTWYTLLGWKGYSNAETRKVIDVLSFRGGKPRFGAAIFAPNSPEARGGRLKAQRVIHGYFFQARMMLQYDPDSKRIVLDHLSPLRPDMAGTNALMGPDLSYDAYVWDRGQWQFQRDIDARDLRPSSKPFNPPPREP